MPCRLTLGILIWMDQKLLSSVSLQFVSVSPPCSTWFIHWLLSVFDSFAIGINLLHPYPSFSPLVTCHLFKCFPILPNLYSVVICSLLQFCYPSFFLAYRYFYFLILLFCSSSLSRSSLLFRWRNTARDSSRSFCNKTSSSEGSWPPREKKII